MTDKKSKRVLRMFWNHYSNPREVWNKKKDTSETHFRVTKRQTDFPIDMSIEKAAEKIYSEYGRINRVGSGAFARIDGGGYAEVVAYALPTIKEDAESISDEALVEIPLI